MDGTAVGDAAGSHEDLVDSPPAARPTGPVDAPHSARRTDIELLRVVAVLGVMAFHFNPGFTIAPNGYLGVDVFFTISGFVITQQMLAARHRGVLTYGWFLARRVRRLLPSAILVIAVTAVGMVLLADRVYLKDQAPAGVAALLYVSNFYFASQSVDYFGGATDVSPFLHFWSLAVEEQFYVVWPFLVIGLAFLARRTRSSFAWALAITSAVLFVASLVGAGLAVQSNASLAFFMPWWRAYQLLLGAMVALWLSHGGSIPRGRIGGVDVVRVLRLAVIVVLVLLYAVPAFGITSPSPWSLLVAVPVAVILATPDARGGDPIVRWGAVKPLAWIATCSYVLYLWHWPVWVLLREVTGVNGAVLVAAAALASVVLGWATHRGVEVPLRDGAMIRRWPNHRTILVGLGASVATAAVLGGVARAVPLPDWQAELTPAITELSKDGSPDTPDCFASLAETKVVSCVRGTESSPRTVMLVGDSHAMQWQGGFVSAAGTAGYRLVTATKQSCPIWDMPVYSERLKRTYTECATWRQNVYAEIAKVKPDVLVLTSSPTWTDVVDDSGTIIENPQAQLDAAVRKTIATVSPSAGRTVVLGDIPLLPKAPGGCLSAATVAADCDFVGDPDGGGLAVVRDAATAAKATVVDAFTRVCPDLEACSMVEGSTIIYRDTNHLTNTMSVDLGPWISEWIAPLVPTA